MCSVTLQPTRLCGKVCVFTAKSHALSILFSSYPDREVPWCSCEIKWSTYECRKLSSPCLVISGKQKSKTTRHSYPLSPGIFVSVGLNNWTSSTQCFTQLKIYIYHIPCIRGGAVLDTARWYMSSNYQCSHTSLQPVLGGKPGRIQHRGSGWNWVLPESDWIASTGHLVARPCSKDLVNQ